MITRWFARLLQHVYKVSCKACTACLQCVVQGFYTMFNMVCKKGVRKVFHNVFHKVFTMCVVIRCVQEIFTMCSQEICTGD